MDHYLQVKGFIGNCGRWPPRNLTAHSAPSLRECNKYNPVNWAASERQTHGGTKQGKLKRADQM